MCGVIKTEVIRNPNTFFSDYNKFYLETFNEKLRNETIDKNTKNDATKTAKYQIVTNTVTHLTAVLSGHQMSLIVD